MIGQTLDRYKIVDELGHGGMSTVYRGEDESLEREVAIKVMHDHLAKSRENRKRFHREAKAIAKLKHANILEIYDYSAFDAKRSYIVMELIHGLNLRQFVTKHGSFPSEIVALLALEIGAALNHAHQSGVIHRDLKPENVMVTEDGHIKLMDFGIAHVIGAETMTQTGSLLGSPAHIPPELIDGEPVDIRSDIYSLGTILYYLATARIPYDGVNAPQVFKKVLSGEYDDPELVDPKVGGHFGTIVRKCMAKSPNERYQTVDHVNKALQEFLDTTRLCGKGEIPRYFKNPKTYKEKFGERLLPKLLEQTKILRQQNDIPSLVCIFNRILAYDPSNTEVSTMMAQLGRRKMSKSAGLVILGLLVIFIGGYVFSLQQKAVKEVVVEPKAIPEKVVEAEPPKDPIEDSQKQSLILSQNIKIHAEKVAAMMLGIPKKLVAKNNKTTSIKRTNNHDNNGTQTQNKTVVEAQTTPIAVVEKFYKYRFSILPAAASFSVDGQSYDVVQARSGITLKEGNHRIVVRSTGAIPFSRTLLVNRKQDRILPVVLKWKPGRIQVVSNTSSVVWVGEQKKLKRISAGGKNATFLIPFGSSDKEDAKKRVRIRVASTQDMGHPKVQRVLVKPGQLTTINVNFQPKK